MRGTLAYTKSPGFGTGFSKKHSFQVSFKMDRTKRIYRIHPGEAQSFSGW
jgi:hypothetical protein